MYLIQSGETWIDLSFKFQSTYIKTAEQFVGYFSAVRYDQSVTDSLACKPELAIS